MALKAVLSAHSTISDTHSIAQFSTKHPSTAQHGVAPGCCSPAQHSTASTAQHTCSCSFHHARAPTRPGGAAKELGHLLPQLNCPAPVGRVLFQARTAIVNHPPCPASLLRHSTPAARAALLLLSRALLMQLALHVVCTVVLQFFSVCVCVGLVFALNQTKLR